MLGTNCAVVSRDLVHDVDLGAEHTFEKGPGMSQDPNVDHLFHLQPNQELAIDVLLRGGTQQEAAEKSGVTRETVNRWCNRHPAFIAELNRRRHSHAQEVPARISDIDARALAVVRDAVVDGDLSAAMGWLRGRKLDALNSQPIGPTNPDDVISDMADKRLCGMLDDAEHRELLNLESQLAGVGADPDIVVDAITDHLGKEFSERD